MNSILINATYKEEIRLAVCRGKTLTDLIIESHTNQQSKGNIYKAKISRIEPSIEAVFVNYGRDRQGFLPFKEIIDTLYFENANGGEKPNVAEALTEGQEIIVQVEKEERDNKGAVLSTFVSLAGSYLIMTPNNQKGIGVSRQIHQNDKRALKTLLDEIKLPAGSGVIARTAAAGKSLEELQWEADYLAEMWRSIEKVAAERPAPFLIYEESDIVIRSVRDYLRQDTDSIIIDDLETFQRVKEFMRLVMPHHLDKLKFFDTSERSLFAHMGVERQLESAFRRQVSLKSGATIVFDHAEALSAIDINSARATKAASIKETALNTNLEATKEIARQLRLRDIGGLIVIDFIDMAEEEHRKAVEKSMAKALVGDRARTQIGTISKFGLLEMSRQRLTSSTSESVEKICEQCSGRGRTPTVPALAITILRDIENTCNNGQKPESLTVQSTVEVVTFLLNEKRESIRHLEEKYAVEIMLLPNPYLQFPRFSLTRRKGGGERKSYQQVSKPTPKLEHHSPKKSEQAAIKTLLPGTKMPRRKNGWFKKIIQSFKKQKSPKAHAGRRHQKPHNRRPPRRKNHPPKR